MRQATFQGAVTVDTDGGLVLPLREQGRSQLVIRPDSDNDADVRYRFGAAVAEADPGDTSNPVMTGFVLTGGVSGEALYMEAVSGSQVIHILEMA